MDIGARGGQRRCLRFESIAYGALGLVQTPTISGFYDIRSFGMGIGGVLDRPTDTLPHGVYGVDHICGPFVLHVQTYGALRFYFAAVAYVHILWQRSILSLQGCTLRVRGGGPRHYEWI